MLMLQSLQKSQKTGVQRTFGLNIWRLGGLVNLKGHGALLWFPHTLLYIPLPFGCS